MWHVCEFFLQRNNQSTAKIFRSNKHFRLKLVCYGREIFPLVQFPLLAYSRDGNRFFLPFVPFSVSRSAFSGRMFAWVESAKQRAYNTYIGQLRFQPSSKRLSASLDRSKSGKPLHLYRLLVHKYDVWVIKSRTSEFLSSQIGFGANLIKGDLSNTL